MLPQFRQKLNAGTTICIKKARLFLIGTSALTGFFLANAKTNRLAVA